MSARALQSNTTAGAAIEEPLDPRRWIGLTVVLFANFMGAMDNFIVNVSSVTIERSLHASFGQIQLVIASYSMSYGVGLITGGRLGDLVGRRRMFRIGTAAFTLTSLASALSPSPSALIGFRLLQGFAAAAMLPQVMSIIQVTFPPHERGKAFGLFGAVSGSSAVAGQIIGGLLIHADILGLGWRAIFMVNVPVGIVSLIVSGIALKETKRGAEIGAGTRLDLPGVVLLAPAVFFIINPLARESSSGWTFLSDVQILLSVVLFAAFFWYEARLERRGEIALVPLRLFHHPFFSNGIAMRILFGWSTSATFLAISFYLQKGAGLTPLSSGLMFITLGAGFVLANLTIRRALSQFWGRIVIFGAITQAIGLGLIITVVSLSGGRHFVALGAAFFVFGVGQGSIAMPINPISMLGLQAKEAGAASGLLLTVSMVSGAIGVAMLGTIYNRIVQSYGRGPFSADALLHHYGRAFATTTWIALSMSILIAALSTTLPRSLERAEAHNARVLGTGASSPVLEAVIEPASAE